MAVSGKFTIRYGTRTVGSTATYQLLGPYVQSKEYGVLRLTFEVVVVASSYAGLQSASENLEDDFRERDKDLVITLDTAAWTYTHGTHIWNTSASTTKTGDSETDVGYSRSYTCEVTGDLPSDGEGSPLLNIEFNVDYESGRRAILSMQGIYTATDGSNSASANYLANADDEATTFTGSISGTFEMVDEQYSYDRNDSQCSFSRQYSQILSDQDQSGPDSTKIRDHRMTFTEMSQHPGDSVESIYRMRRVVGTYDCAIDVIVSTDLYSLVEDTILPHVKQLFETNFQPQVFTVEDHRFSYDESSKRVSISIQFLYQKDGGDDIVEVTQSMSYREQRNLDMTPVHLDDEFAAEVDVGWAVLDRIATRTVVVIGDETPKRRIGVTPDEGIAGPIVMPGSEPPAGKGVVQNGWNIISNTSQTQERWMGDPNETQIKMTVLTETVVERWNTSPSNRTSSGGQKQ